MKEIRFLFKQMAKLEPIMFILIGLYSIFMGLRPFVWIISPAYILKNADKPFSFFLTFFIGLMIISSLMSFMDSFIMNNYRMRMNNVRYHFIRMITSYSLNLDFDEQKDKEKIEIINNALKACESPFSGAGGIMMNLPIFLSILISISGFIWIFFSMGLILFSIILLTSTLSFYLSYKMTIFYQDYYANESEIWNIFSKLNYQLRSPESKKDIQIFNFISLFRSYYMDANKKRIMEYKGLNERSIKLFNTAKLIDLFRNIIIFIWLIKSLVNGLINLGDFYIYFTAIFAFVSFTNDITWNISAFRTSEASFKYFFKIFEGSKVDNTYKSLPTFDKLRLEFKNVYFAYPNTNTYILKDINLTIEDGQSLALVGENGAGKSTLAHLICGFYKVSKGEILLNGVNINDYGPNYRQILAAIFQDSSLLPFSIKENILFDSSDKNLDVLYKKTGLDEIINSYDKTENQVLLRILDEEGIDLSGGQKQRIFLARALNKDKARILLLDEPTSQLDALAERDLYMAYNDLKANVISIFISHRLASTKFCDRVIFLKDGKIIGDDPHEILLKENAEYKNLYDLQAKAYKEAK
ncbi:MAG: ABC transporter ATP-binding protein [Anaerococcus sp.]|nr:ABC transporter ATP-binding protein [Anaerococcus sp.]